MNSLGHYFAVIHYQELVGPGQWGQPVGDNNTDPLVQKWSDGTDYPVLGFNIHCREAVINDNYRSFSQQNPGQGYTLPLPPG
jgi:hypothetical protein